VAELRRLFGVLGQLWRSEHAGPRKSWKWKWGKFETQAKAQSTQQLRNIPSQSHSAAQSRLLERAGRERGAFCSQCTCVGWLTNHHLVCLSNHLIRVLPLVKRVRQNDPTLTELE
jgi:hypothetical protein